MGSDGLWDNLWEDQVLEAVAEEAHGAPQASARVGGWEAFGVQRQVQLVRLSCQHWWDGCVDMGRLRRGAFCAPAVCGWFECVRRCAPKRGQLSPPLPQAGGDELAAGLAQRLAAVAFEQSGDPAFVSPFSVERQARMGDAAAAAGVALPAAGGKRDDVCCVVAVVEAV